METKELKIGGCASIIISGESGVIMGVAHYVNTATQYLVHYCDGNGCAKSDWFYSDQLTAE